MGMISLKRGPGTKVPYSFMNSGVKGKGKGISRSGKVLRIEPASRKVSSSFPSSLPCQKASAEAPEEGLCQRPQIKRLLSKETGLGIADADQSMASKEV